MAAYLLVAVILNLLSAMSSRDPVWRAAQGGQAATFTFAMPAEQTDSSPPRSTQRTPANVERRAMRDAAQAQRDAAKALDLQGLPQEVQDEIRKAMASANLDELTHTWRLWSVNDRRIDVDVDDACALTALHDVFKHAGLKCGFDEGLPEDRRITLHAKAVRLATVVDLITQSAGIGWRFDARRDRSTGKMDTFYHIVREPLPAFPDFRAMSPMPPGAFVSPTVPNVSSVVMANPSTSGMTFTIRSTEERSSFRCPHCKRRVVTVRSVNSPPWRFCPICGRRLELDEPTETADVLEPGRQVEVKISSSGRETEYGGTYTISNAGTIRLSGMTPISVMHMTPEQASAQIKSVVCSRLPAARVTVILVSR